MRVLLVTWTDQLLEKLSILSPELEYCAIVVDEVEPAEKILNQVGLSADLLCPLYDLKECVNNFRYDCLLCVTDDRTVDILTKQAVDYGLPKNKFVHFHGIYTPETFSLKLLLDYYQRHAAEFAMFATGISYTAEALVPSQFKYKLIKFAYGSQDLYYDYKIAKLLCRVGGGGIMLRAYRFGSLQFSV